jgi:hypothetical protein
MTEEQEREQYWKLVNRVSEYIELSGRTIEDVLEEFEEDL